MQTVRRILSGLLDQMVGFSMGSVPDSREVAALNIINSVENYLIFNL